MSQSTLQTASRPSSTASPHAGDRMVTSYSGTLIEMDNMRSDDMDNNMHRSRWDEPHEAEMWRM